MLHHSLIIFLRRLTVVGTLLLLTACAAQQGGPEGVLAAAEAPRYPGISLFYKHLSDDLEQECAEFQSRSMLHHCSEGEFHLSNLQQALTQSGAFQQVTIAGDHNEFQVMVSTVVLDQESGSEIGNAALSGATLMLVPIKIEKTIRAEVVITWQNLPIKRYDYTLPFNYSASLLTPTFNYRKELSQRIAAQLLGDLQQENAFAGAQVMAALEASDYGDDLGIGDSVGGYFFDEKHIFSNPFHGAVLSFIHRQFAFDHAEVFVYPVRNTDWHEAAALTQSEAENVRTELSLMQRQGNLNALELDDPTPLQWIVDGQRYDGTFYSGHLIDNEGREARTATYIFIKGDKFVRTQAVFPLVEGSAKVNNPDDFARSLLQQLEPPTESPFMARLRRERRQSIMEMSAKE